MAEALLFSQHSSNPLEVGSSDRQNRAYLRTLRANQAAVESSDDPIGGYDCPEAETEMTSYRRHLAGMFPNYTALQQQRTAGVAMVDLDEDDDMSGDEGFDVVERVSGERSGDLPVLGAQYEGQNEEEMGEREDEHSEGLAAVAEVHGLGDEPEYGVEPDGIDAAQGGERPYASVHDERYSPEVLRYSPEVEMDADDVDIADDESDVYEETTLSLKPPEEREEIEEEINNLEDAVPQLSADYKLIDRLGTGTFSSVYKALDVGHHVKWDNAVWRGRHPPGSSAYYQSAPRPRGSRVFVAVKRIYVTSNPERIRNEVAIMEDCRACRHVAQLITAFRHQDQVVIIMPYQRCEDFKDFHRTLPMVAIKAYFRSMFRALRDIHARGIIHRDVKPANFLFDPRTGIGTLCDFGLACRMGPGPSLGACLHEPPTAKFPHGRLRKVDPFQTESIKKLQREARQRSGWPSERVGYPKEDLRPHSKANRAGTRGFRAPEVLFKCGEQTGAVDVWSAGMILLFFLAGKFPLFQSNDDIEALMEIAAIIGKRQMEKAATLHGRTFASNVPSLTPDGVTWRAFVERQNPALMEPRPPIPHYFPYNIQPSAARRPGTHPPTSSSPTSGRASGSISSDSYGAGPSSPRGTSLGQPTPEEHTADVEAALDLVARLMEPEAVRRWTPRQALYHRFLAEPGDDAGDDKWFPHPFGRGVCGALHFKDEVTEEPCVRVRVRVPGKEGEDADAWEVRVRRLASGEGTAIGNRPCEFHEHDFEVEGGE